MTSRIGEARRLVPLTRLAEESPRGKAGEILPRLLGCTREWPAVTVPEERVSRHQATAQECCAPVCFAPSRHVRETGCVESPGCVVFQCSGHP
jgi:hypothetical protein